MDTNEELQYLIDKRDACILVDEPTGDITERIHQILNERVYGLKDNDNGNNS